MSDSATPGWLKGLIILFALTSALTLGLYLYRHSEEAALYEHYRNLLRERDELRVFVPRLEQRVQASGAEPSPLDAQILARRRRIQEITGDESNSMLDVNRLVGEAAVKTQAIARLTQDEARKYEQLLADARARRAELAQEEERALAMERDLDTRRLGLREQLELIGRELESLKREARNSNSGLDVRIDELDERIEQLTQQRDLNNRELRSDGQLLASRATDGFVVIDRGIQQNLRKGMRFVVFNRRGGRNIIKGSVEVVEVEARLSTCRVMEEKDANDPLIPGDHIHNPVYNPTDVKIFVFSGDFTTFSKEELSRFVTEAGGRVDDNLSTATDYLVAGGRSEAALAQASKLGISILSEDQCVDLIRLDSKFAIREGMRVALRGKFNAVSAGTVKTFVERAGGVVVGSLDRDTQVLIAGDDAGDDIATARSLGITVINHTQFAHLND